LAWDGCCACLIVVLDLHGLARHHAQHVGMIFATALIKHDGVFGNVEGAAAETVFDIDEHVGEIAARYDYVSASFEPLQAGSWLMSIFDAFGLCHRTLQCRLRLRPLRDQWGRPPERVSPTVTCYCSIARYSLSCCMPLSAANRTTRARDRNYPPTFLIHDVAFLE